MVNGGIKGYRDDFVVTAPVGSFLANRFGLYDLGGNLWEWCEDEYWPSTKGLTSRVLRGAQWGDNDRSDIGGGNRGSFLSSKRFPRPPDSRQNLGYGFRVVLAPVAATQGGAAAPSGAASVPSVTNPPSTALGGPSALPSAATKDQPFTNTLGMKFVPVPGTNILMGIHETRRQDYRVYADAVPGTDATWKAPVVDGKPLVQGEDHPVFQVSWDDSMAFCAWLGKKEGRTYRLPTEHEWNLAVAIGVENPHEISPAELQEWITDSYPWPTPALPLSTIRIGHEERELLHQKYAKEHQKAWEEGSKNGNYRKYAGSQDNYEGTAPVMSFLPNHLGIHDLGGNVWEWCSKPTITSGTHQPLRGCGFRNFGWYIVSSTRVDLARNLRDWSKWDSGFRCVVELPETTPGTASATPPPVSPSPSLPVSSSSSSATKDAPFVNTLGMKFVPVPGTKVLMCIHETRRQDYAAYAKEVPGVDGAWMDQSRNGVPCGDKDDHPVVGVSLEEAQKFCEWLGQKEEQIFRLPTDREWSYAVGIGDSEKWTNDLKPKSRGTMHGVYPWGSQWPPPKGSANYADTKWHESLSSMKFIEGYADGFATTAPVMSFKPNVLGIYDMGGNVWEWVPDWFDTTEQDVPVRGGAFDTIEQSFASSSHRHRSKPKGKFGNIGFRIVVELPEAAPASTNVSPAPSLPVSSSPSSAATKDAPFVNTLGMKFVPVPGTKVLMCIHETRRQDCTAYAAEMPGVDSSWNNRTWYGVIPGIADN